MPLFGKKEKKIDMPEVVDFSNDTWSFKGNPPVYQIQSDGFTYDIVDADGNDKNAISLGLAGMLVIVLNAKSPKIKEDELLPQFGKVIKTRNWHTMTVKDANFLVQTAIKKLTNSSTSGDVFDLASYAPLEVKRVLLKTLFTMSRLQLPPEYREEAEHRVIDDIVPDIFANPDYELALLTGLIVKPDDKAADPVSSRSSRIETAPILDNVSPFNGLYASDTSNVPEEPSLSAPEPDSAFAELQKIYGRRIDTPQVRAAAAQQANVSAANSAEVGNNPSANAPQSGNPFAAAEPVSMRQNASPNFAPQPAVSSNEPTSVSQAPVFSAPFSAPHPNNPLGENEINNGNQGDGVGVSQPVNPFGAPEPRSIPQPAAPNFAIPQPNNPFAANQGAATFQAPQNIPQPPAPNYMQQVPNSNYSNPMNQQGQNQGYPQGYPTVYPQGNPYYGNFQQQYPPQMWQQNQPIQQNTQQPQGFPQQNWQMNYQQSQNMPYNVQNMQGMSNSENTNPQTNPAWQNQPYNYTQPSQPNTQNN